MKVKETPMRFMSTKLIMSKKGMPLYILTALDGQEVAEIFVDEPVYAQVSQLPQLTPLSVSGDVSWGRYKSFKVTSIEVLDTPAPAPAKVK